VSRRRDAGFTILELMFVIGIIAILAGVAMPSFFDTARKAKGTSEVNSVFSDLRTRLDQYYLENAQYPLSESESTTWPVAPTSDVQTALPLPADWQTLKVRISGDTSFYCGYAWMTGLPNDNSNIGPIAAAAPFNFTAPAVDWYYLFAHCNIDGDSTTDSYYISTSVDTKIVVVNEGH
jgi:prepilin-type N-terminal cleavage/methylation domain-containing protein